MSGKTARRDRQRVRDRETLGGAIPAPVSVQNLGPPEYTPSAVSAVLDDEAVARVRAGVLEWDREAERLKTQRRALVEHLRERGMVWDGIGWLLGTTGEGARQRYGR